MNEPQYEAEPAPVLFDFMSPKIDLLAAALAAAQSEMPNAAFNRINPHFKSQYADLAAIRDASLPALTANGLSVAQFPVVTVTGMILYTLLMHKSGQWLRGEYPIAAGTPQAIGSQLTYARRYSWSSITGVAADDDDDAEVAQASVNVPRAGPQKSAYRARKDGDWETFKTEMEAINSPNGLKVWGMANSERIHAMPHNWQQHFREMYDRRMTELKEGVTEEGGSTVKQQLKQSLKEEGANE